MNFPTGPRSGVFVFSAIVTLLASSSLLWSQIVTVPPGLAPGQEYRVMFAFSGASVTSDDIAHYNTLAQAAAAGTPELAALNTTWHAVGSTATVDARDNTGTNPNVEAGVPIYTWSGHLLALDNADLWDGTWSAQPISGARMYWHGTGPDGTAFDAQALGYGADIPNPSIPSFGPLALNAVVSAPKIYNPMPIGMVSKSAHRQIGSIHDVAATQSKLDDPGGASWSPGFTLGLTDDATLAGMWGLSGVLVVPEVVAEVSIARAHIIRFETEIGSNYILQSTEDMEIWSDTEMELSGDGNVQEFAVEATKPVEYYRVRTE